MNLELMDTVWLFIASHVVASLVYYVKLNTRVAVLEASHDAMTQDLKEIKQDVKELLRSVTS